MSVIGSSVLAGASGSAGGDPVYVDDVFSTFVYTGNGTARSINNGIDLAGEGGLVWIKNRDNGYQDHVLNDTERGAGQTLRSDSANAQFLSTARFSAFNSNGFSVGTDTGTNNNNEDIVSWTFRKAPGFFDVVTYTGNGSVQNISHNLGSIPGMIIVKNLTTAANWETYHRSTGATKKLELNESSAAGTNSGTWNNTEPTSSVFTVGTNNSANGANYVAYIFAHDDAQYGTDSDESIIKCGSFTGIGFKDIGFEPQFLLVKRTDGSGYWQIYDNMRGVGSTRTDAGIAIYPNTSDQEGGSMGVYFESTGFYNDTYGSATCIYMAIRRPHKPPEAATEVFAIDTGNSSSTIPAFDSGFPVDFAFRLSAYASGGNNPRTHSRLQGAKELYTSASAAEAADSPTVFDSMTGMSTGFNSNDIAWMFKRAPGFMDVVAYSGNSSNQNVSHNLGVAPEFYIVKRRSAAEDWATYAASLGANKYNKLNQTAATYTNTTIWNNTSPTSSVFTVGNDVSVNGSGDTYIAYLFATLPGISKVGSYTGTGSALNIDCGFTAGARFVLIKRTDGTGNWYLFDTTRGIVSGNDFALALNLSSAQISGDYIDPLAAGFTINGSYAQWNESGGTYMFLAIA